MPDIILKGITWGHSRGITPLLACSQRFTELHPHVGIEWDTRSLQQFADFPIETLTKTYDLLIVDHPWVGRAAASACVLPLEEYLTDFYLEDQLKNSTGLSHISYFWDTHQWALAIDAATPVASYRADLLTKHKISVPEEWEEVLALAKDGKVAAPAIPIDLLMNFYMFCIAHGNEPFQNEVEIVNWDTGLAALETMTQLYSVIDKKMFHCNPISVAELMSQSNDYWYCPFAYGYSNYSRIGYADSVLTYTDLVKLNDQQLRSTLGGTGIAVSTDCQHKEIALAYVKMVASARIQKSMYVEHGGQPSHRSAWTAAGANSLTNNFFTNTLPALDRAYMRPRYDGYLNFQDAAGIPLQAYLLQGGNPEKLLKALNVQYQKSIIKQPVFTV